MRLGVVAIALVLGAPVIALASPAPTAIAVRAAQTHEEHCSTVEGTDRTDSARAIAEVSAVLGDVSEAWDLTGETYLLYWRGVLSACIGQSDDARSDLSAFLESADAKGPLSSLRTEAKRRLRRLDVGGRPAASAARPGSPGAGFAIALGSGAGALAGLAAWQGSERERLRAALYAGDVQRDDYAEHLQIEEDAWRAGLTLGVGAAALGVTAAVVGIASGAARKTGASSMAVAPLVIPHGGGIQVGGRW